MIPTKEQNPNGLHLRFRVERTDGKPIDPNAEYFVLRLDDSGSNTAHIAACRKAILTYAKEIEPQIPQLAADLQARYGKFGKQVIKEEK